MKLSGSVRLEALWREPLQITLSIPEEDCHIKTSEAFLGSSGTSCIFRYTVVEGRLTQYVQVILSLEEGEYTLKLDRSYPILRSPGVKLLIGLVGAWLEERGLTVESHNISSHRQRGAFYINHRVA